MSAKATKKSAFSCEPCRRRKVKCGGEQPICRRCATRNDDCIYKLNPTLTYTHQLEERIKELEDRILRLTRSPPSIPASSHSSPAFSSPRDDASQDTRAVTEEGHISRSFKNLKIDDKGGITYHGATSFFNLPIDRNASQSPGPAFAHSSMDTDTQRRERLITNAWHQRALENLSDVPEPFHYLLNVHWCWIQPMFNFIYRPVFTRDMQSMGPYYSHTLLNAVISHSIRWGRSDPATRRLLDESYQGGIVFSQHARSMLFQELSAGVCTIPTIQTLLLLAAQECSLGNSTQAWTYSGIAFRLLDHLGICVDSQRFVGSVPLTDEELEIRRRIYWGCFLWDKLICLYLGRSPSLRHTKISPSQIMFDDSTENDLWVPFGMSHTDSSWNYPPQTAHSASCFVNMCRLSVILNEILIHMYDPLSQNTNAEIQECLDTQEPLLQLWWDELPLHLKMTPSSLPALAPPSHIVTLNCLYHAFKILLYRPMLTGRGQKETEGTSPFHRYLVEGVTSATSIIAIFDLFCRTFTINYCVLSLAYCIYIASSVFLLQVQAAPDDHQAMCKLKYCIQCLQQVRQISPVIASALKNISNQLSALGISSQESTSQKSPRAPSWTGNSPSTGSSPLSSGPAYSTSPDINRASLAISPPAYQPSFSQNFGPDAMSMGPGVFETMSTLEPLSIRVSAVQDLNGSSSSPFS